MRRGAKLSSSRLLRLGAHRMHRSCSSMAQGTMYNWRVKAVNDALCSQGKAEGMLQIEDLVALGHLDQYHYLGVAACDEAAEVLGLGPGSNVLDLGSGIGGPARYLAATTGCSVMGVELQPELCEAATALTARVEGLADRVKFVAGDAVALNNSPLPAPFEASGFDHYLSQLVNLHVPDRAALLAAAFHQLREGGTFYIEDFCQLAPLQPEDPSILADLVHAPSVSSVGAYVAELEAVGFVDIEAVDMSGPWTKWNRARADGYAATKAAAVALHGEDIFASRQIFYSAVARLFDGGSIGGVRLTGRKPGRHERRLHAARRSATKKGTAASGNVRILENGHGFNSDHAADTPPLALAPHAQLITGAATSQPPLPWTTGRKGEGVHDSLQYHFFLSGLFLAIRVFHTSSLQSVTAWAYDYAEPESGAIELVNSYAPLAPQPGSGLNLANDELAIVDDATDGGSIRIAPTSTAATALLARAGVPVGPSGRPELVLAIEQQGHVYSWVPVGASDDLVIHRPQMRARLDGWRGAAPTGYGYSKRYHGIYARYNQWRFIHGVADTQGLDAPPPAIVWTADATFGDKKYNYFKLLSGAAHKSGEIIEASKSETYNQEDAGYATIDGKRYEAHVHEIASWHTIIGGGAGQMEAKYENRLCELTLMTGDEQFTTGVAYNERYLGTLW